MSNDELPEGWSIVRLAEVVEHVPNVKPEDEPDREFGYVDISSICNRTHKILDCKRFTGNKAPSRARRPIRPGDVLFSNVRTYLRNVAIVPPSLNVQLCSTGFTVLRSNGAVDPHFLFRYVLMDDYIDRVTPQQTGTHYPATSDRVVLGESLPLPPLAEQKRIVAKVEQLLARVNAARERLARVPAILKRFRQAVLAAACSGRLTADWREDERETKGIPSSWRHLELEALLSEPLANGRSVVDATGSGFPVLRLTALKAGRIELAERKIGAWSLEEAKPFLVKRGDFLVARGNGSLKLVGRGGLVVNEPDQVAYPDTLIRVRPNKTLLLPEFLPLVWDAPPTREQIEAAAHTTAGIHKVSQKDLRGISLPVPPLAEQHEIIRRVEALFKLADAIEKRAAAATQRVEKLTQAILAKAFRGELVPTEAELARIEGRDYEPASALLERIRREQGTAPKRITTKRARR